MRARDEGQLWRNSGRPPESHRWRPSTPGIGHGAVFAVGIATLALGCLDGPAMGQDLPTEGGRLAIEASLQVQSRYLFRGHEKDGRGAVLQPAIGLDYALLDPPT